MNKGAPTAKETPVSLDEARSLFSGLERAPALILAVSGGPDSTALLALAARWRAGLERGPDLVAVTVDHGFRRESAREARAVKKLAKSLGVRHRTMRWIGQKPATGLQEAGRAIRYRLLVAAGVVPVVATELRRAGSERIAASRAGCQSRSRSRIRAPAAGGQAGDARKRAH